MVEYRAIGDNDVKKCGDFAISVEEVISSLSPMPLLTISSPTTIEKCSQLTPQQTDIFISSYPKSGTTWTQHIVISLLLLHRKKVMMMEADGTRTSSVYDENIKNLQYEHVSDYAPFYEIDAHWNGDDLVEDIRGRHNQIGRRVFNTHLRGNMLPVSSNNSIDGNSGDNTSNQAKVIYVIRSPLDTCVSFYHHLSHQNEGCYDKGFNAFFQEWIDGDIPFGSWSDHLLSFAPLMASRDVMVLSYEEMIQNLPLCVERLVNYLGLDDVITKEDVTHLLPTFEFASMKNNLKRFQPKSVTWRNKFKFLRKGVVGNHEEIINEGQKDQFKRHLKDMQFFDTLNLILGDSREEVESYMKMWRNMR